MYELSRVRLHSVGPAGARYQDVVLDLSEVGPVVRSPAQDALFSAGIHAAAQGLPRRPSPASVLFLENGGGKSVLIKLIFSVMLPGRRQVVGTTNTRVLEKFVTAKDVSHVVLEWQHTETGQRVITGKVSEWRGHVASADPANLIDSWYCFRPTGELGLESLPFTAEGRLLTMSGFQERLDAAQHAEPELELFWTRRQHEWTERMDSIGLDTELFRYQRAMNAGEGEAADAFNFSNDEAFVEFLLKAVISEEDPRDLAEVVKTYAHNLSQRGDLLAERDFVAGALDLLAPLTEEEAMAAASRKLAATARAEAQELAGSIAARHKLESDRLAGLAAHVDETRDAEKLAEGDHRRLTAVVTELRRVVADLRLNEATAEKKRVESELAEARSTANAWRETTTVLNHVNAVRKAADIRELVGEREQSAKPALEAKNAAATALARGLLALAAQAEEQASAAEGRAEAARTEAANSQEQRDTATGTAAKHRAEHAQLTARIDEVRTEVRQAVRDGLLGDGSEVATEAQQARTRAEDAAQELTKAEAEVERIGEDYGQAQSAVHAAQQRESSARSKAGHASEELIKAYRRTDALAANPRLLELLGGDTVQPETDTPQLLKRLRDARAEAEREQTALRIEESVDERALGALGSGGLLPAPPEAQAALDVLEQAGVTAWSGWRYLSTMDAKRRERVLAEQPHLVGGVLVNEAAQLDRAKKALADAKLLPSVVLPVGVTAAMKDDAAPAAAGVGFLVTPNPAMYDEDAADAEREAIAARHSRRQKQLEALSTAINDDAALEWKLTTWREDYPAGAIGTLAEEAEAASAEQSAAETAVTEAERNLTELRDRRARLRETIPSLRSEVRDGEDRSRALTALAGKVAKIPEWTDAAERAQEILTRAETEAEQATGRASRLREEAAEEQRTADGHRRTVSSARAELAEVPGGGSVSADDPVPQEPVDALRRAFASASDAYAKVEVGSDLRAELDQAESAESAARAALEALEEATRELAGRLLETADGSDAATRAAAQARAGRAVASLEEEYSEAIGVVATRKAELEGLPKQPSSLENYSRPRDIEHGMELIDSASEEATTAARAWERAQARRAEAEQVLDAANTSAAGFRLLAESLAHLAPEGEAETAFDGDVETAQSRYAKLNSTLTEAEAAVDQAEKRVRAAADALAQYATEKRFEKLSSPVRQQIISVRRDSLPASAREWTSALRPRLRTLTDDLAQIDRHRSGIVSRLQGMVDGALRMLRSAQRLSRLPEGLGDWSGQEFLRVRFADPEENVLAEALGEVVDEAAAGKTSDGRDVKRDGMSLVLRGVRAAVPKGFRVDMLKPDSVLRTERQRVSEIRDVFSGGQQLTAAIILYCTLAALRANNRGKMRNRHSGVLFLDNPIGRASAGYLLELQRVVARALGVQLIYTTGLFDAGALSEFPLIIRLRNDADLRAGRKYLSVDAAIRGNLDELGDADGVARISATRLFSKPGEEAPTDETSGEEPEPAETH
jgi:chromosome segregation ATPase